MYVQINLQMYAGKYACVYMHVCTHALPGLSVLLYGVGQFLDQLRDGYPLLVGEIVALCYPPGMGDQHTEVWAHPTVRYPNVL